MLNYRLYTRQIFLVTFNFLHIKVHFISEFEVIIDSVTHLSCAFTLTVAVLILDIVIV